MITRTVAGFEITLPPGVYIATRPARGPGDVMISRRDNGRIVLVLRDMTTAAAARLTEAFNEGSRLDGREW